MADGRSHSRIRGRNPRRLAGAALLTGPMLQPSYKSVRALAEARLVRRQRAALLASLARPQPPLQPLRFYFLLPAFRAVEDVEGAYEWFRDLTVPDEVRATIVFITTDRDGPLDDNETAGAVRRLLAAV